MLDWLKEKLKAFVEKKEQERWKEAMYSGERFELPGCEECWGFEQWNGDVFWVQNCISHKNYWIRRQELETQDKEKD